jgi:hypothetical protein
MKTMIPDEQESAARRRAFSQRLLAAIDAQRRLDAPRADGRATRSGPIGPKDPRYTYLTQSHD